MSREPMTVSDLTTYIKDTIENDPELANVTVVGEISNFKYHSSGHMYFTLKDKNAKIKCVMFKTYSYFLKFMPEDGMNVIIQGYVSVYERDGQYQFYCCKMEPEGIGSLHLAFEQLKAKLQSEGLFDEDRKKDIPLYPGKIGIATSPTGSVIRDIINVASKRYNNVSLVLYPVKVQGEGSAGTIVEAIEYFNKRNDIDVIIIGRGGGSIEELWTFNEEILARAIFNSSIPIISAVGHETDFTIADFVADVRASTPSHAAEIAVPSYINLKCKIENLESAAIQNIKNRILNDRYHLKSLVQAVEANSPRNIILQNIQYMDNVQNKLIFCIKNKLLKMRNSFQIKVGKLDSLSPLGALGKGYAVVEQNGSIIKNASSLEPESEIKLRMQGGAAYCKVLKIMEGELWHQEKKI